jgi:SHS family lactate transporter-like MFS transporter
VAPLYLLTRDLTWIAIGFIIQECAAGGMQGQMPPYLARAVPDRGACNSQRVLHPPRSNLVPLILSYFAVQYELGFAIPMMVGTCVGALSFACALLLSSEAKGTVLVPDLQVA